MNLRTLVAAALLAGTPAFAHGDAQEKNHAKKGEHKEAPRSFATKPAAGTWAKCAVSDEVFQVDGDTGMSEYKGRWYVFCCPECKPDFDKEPGKYAEK
jgi:hypothetical protein